MFFIGHHKNWQLLVAEAKKNRLPPVYLFHGANGIGKRLVAQTLVQWHFCHSLAPSLNLSIDKQGPCGTCDPCRLITENHHPDYHLVEPEGKSIKIDRIREVQSKLKHAPLEAPLKIVLIDEAQVMTRSAANSLLKTLEEPPKNSLFLLVAHSLFKILPTIRSRSRLVYFSAPPLEKATSHFSAVWDIPVERTRELLELADGSPGLAQKMAAEEFEEFLDRWESLTRRQKKSFTECSRMVQTLAQKDTDLFLFLETIKKKYLREIVEQKTWAPLSKIDLLHQAQRDLDRNVNKMLVLENLLMELYPG